jgi:hypothetical protein
VWPEWLQKITASPIGKTRIGIAGDPSSWRAWSGAVFEHTSRVLCWDCNHELGELEGRAAQLIGPMVNGEYVRLDKADQELLARWFFKTGLMVSTTYRHEATSLPSAHYSGLGKSLDLPPASAVWIAQVENPEYVAALWVQRFQWRDRELAAPPEGQGYMFAMSVGHLAALVAVVDSRQSPESSDLFPFKLGGLAVGRLARIWPNSEHYGVHWPPTMKITAVEFQQLADSLQRLGPPFIKDGETFMTVRGR